MPLKPHKPLKPLILLEDEPVRHADLDWLGIQPYADTIARASIGTTGPFTIGVFAEWGEGKTSLLRQAKQLVDLNNKETKIHQETCVS